MKHLLLIPCLALLINLAPCLANSHSYTFNYENLVSVEIIIPDTQLWDTNMFFQEPFDQGKYKGANGYDRIEPAIATGIVTSLFAPVGLIVFMVISTTPPDPYSFSWANKEYLKHPSYLKGFREGLLRTKKRLAWDGFLVGLGVSIAIDLMLFIAIRGL